MSWKNEILSPASQVGIATHKGLTLYAWGSMEIQELLERQTERAYRAGVKALASWIDAHQIPGTLEHDRELVSVDVFQLPRDDYRNKLNELLGKK